MKVLFLYSELAGYVVSYFHVLAPKVSEIHVIRWPVNREAPFDFHFPEKVNIYEREAYDTRALVDLVLKINPDRIVCSGWMDKGYLKVCRAFKGKIPTILSMDNHWQGTLRQQLMRVLAPFTLHRWFSHAWVPGDPQRKYALLLGFHDSKIDTGFYSADTEYFSSVFGRIRLTKEKKMPHRFLYVGRYIESKGISTLWNAFIQAIESAPEDWELWCLGTGDLFDQRIIHPNIKHFGFVQPAKLEEFLTQTSIFILPSRFEPWGVVVHEMAASGMPLICSDEVGAASLFLKPGINGYSFESGNEKQLKELLIKMMSLNDETILKMGEQSQILSKQITPAIWAEKLLNFSL